MSFTEELILKVIESGVIALVLLIIGHWLNKNLSKFKNEQAKMLELEKQNNALQNTLLQDKRTRKLEKINKQLAEFYFPIYYRLQKDDATWKLSRRLNPENDSLPHEASDIVENDYLIPNHKEILQIIQSKSHLINYDPDFHEQIRRYIRNVAVYTTIRQTKTLHQFNPDHFDAVYPARFKEMIEANISKLQQEYDQIFNQITSGIVSFPRVNKPGYPLQELKLYFLTLINLD